MCFDIETGDVSIHVEVSEVPASNFGALRKTGEHLKKQIGNGVLVLGSVIEGKPTVVVMATDDSIKSGIHSGNIAKAIAGFMGGGGGGNPAVAQAGGKNAEQLPKALAATERIIRESLSGRAGD